MFKRIKSFLPARCLPATAAVEVAAGDGAQVLVNGTGAEAANAFTDSVAANAANASIDASAADSPNGASATGDAARRTPAQRTGALGEALAAEHLAEKGHRLLERNWRAGRDEIDLITLDGACLVFVEVRTRAENALVGGYHSISARKKAALRRVCGAYLKNCHPRPRTYRLDVVQITLGKGGQKIIHHYAGLALFN